MAKMQWMPWEGIEKVPGCIVETGTMTAELSCGFKEDKTKTSQQSSEVSPYK